MGVLIKQTQNLEVYNIRNGHAVSDSPPGDNGPFDAAELTQLKRRSRWCGHLSLPDACSPKISPKKLQTKRNTDQRKKQQEQWDQKDVGNGRRCPWCQSSSRTSPTRAVERTEQFIATTHETVASQRPGNFSEEKRHHKNYKNCLKFDLRWVFQMGESLTRIRWESQDAAIRGGWKRQGEDGGRGIQIILGYKLSLDVSHCKVDKAFWEFL